jgi:UDP-glucose 4-epimerase
VTILDDLSTGHREAVGDATLIEANLLDDAALDAAIAVARPEIVFHFAALSIVRHSVLDPLSYYRNNVTGTLGLLASMRRHGISRLVFSSSAAVYGMPTVPLIDESHSLLPINPYGSTKMAVERMLDEAAVAYGLRSVSLRYFNAAGADPSGGIGESHDPETHLIPNALSAAAKGGSLQVFGNDYPTPDGTCIRDYVHVNDLARAHLDAARYIDAHDGSHHFNLGSGTGCSVMQIIEAVRRVTGRKVGIEIASPRAGDPAQLVADCRAVRRELGWTPRLSDIETMVDSAWQWQLHRGY